MRWPTSSICAPSMTSCSRCLAANGRACGSPRKWRRWRDPATYRPDPGEAWRRFRLRGRVDPRFFGVLREVAAWRETAAQQRNLPRGRIVRDEAVLEIAAHVPKTIDDLARTRSLGKGFAEGRLGGEILDAVAARPRRFRRRRAAAVAEPRPRPASARSSICCGCC